MDTNTADAPPAWESEPSCHGLGAAATPRQPAARHGSDELVAAATALQANRTLRMMLETIPDPSAVLNASRQILLANQAFCRATGKSTSAVLGLRPGDAMECLEAMSAEGGCGTAENCRYCGAGGAFTRLEQGEHGPLVEECLIATRLGGRPLALEFQASLNGIGDGLSLIVLRDISNDKRRAVLERAFFHDLLNTANGIQGLAELAAMDGDEDIVMLGQVATALVEEIQHHRTIMQAEAGRLEAVHEAVVLQDLGADVAGTLARSSLGEVRHLVCDIDPITISTDHVLLRRCLVNLGKNAFEARADDSPVTLRARLVDGQCEILMHNTGTIPEAVAAQIFRRSFSTKGGSGRGVGTWSVRMLVEEYLGGAVDFVCADGGTTFRIRLPAAAAG